MVDHFSRWAIAVPLQINDAATTARAITEELICKFGLPSRILSDRGTPFHNKLVSELCQLFGVRQLLTAAYRPQSNGLVERFNGTLKTTILALETEFNTQWIHVLQPAVFAYNTSILPSLGISPFYTLFGYQPITPRDAIAQHAMMDDDNVPKEAYVETLHQNIQAAHAIVRSLQNENQRAHLAELQSR